MTTAIQFWDYSVWDFLLTLSLLFGAMLLANGLRRSIPVLKKSLIPSSVIGGFLMLACMAIWKAAAGAPLIPSLSIEALTYHGLGLG
ncbi:MAG: hypothetical protein IIZ49_04320, partial [Oscillospiraceae bacterium]|nr:hypothetical protein [Oscillospiraceae bacterium]